MKIRNFDLVNEDKVKRALNGALVKGGKLSGGLKQREDWKTLTTEKKEEEMLAKYDRLGGLIMKGEIKVALGSFYDFGENQKRKTPDIKFEAIIDGDIVEVKEDEAKAINVAKKKKKEKRKKKQVEIKL